MAKAHSFYPAHKSLVKHPTDGSHVCKLSNDDLAEELKRTGERLGELQELLFAENRRRVLIVLQGLDTSGKDGTVKHVFSETNPQGVRVASFKEPSSLEQSHDYLWRIHQQLPRKGEIVIFNRSYYEDYIFPRVHKSLPKKQVQARIEQIQNFEKMLVEEDTVLLKFFLHISKKEQAERIEARLENPKKHWKFSLSDLTERRYWGEYQKAYSEIIWETHHKSRPWFVIPADNKKIRDYEISRILIERMESLDMKYPKMNAKELQKIQQEAAKALRK